MTKEERDAYNANEQKKYYDDIEKERLKNHPIAQFGKKQYVHYDWYGQPYWTDSKEEKEE